MKNTMTKNITIRDIIYSRIDFIENNNIFDKKEYMYVNKGEIEAYSEILTDIELLTIDAFVEKYLCILKKVSEKLDNEHNLGDNEQERMSGYNNCIVFVLSLIIIEIKFIREKNKYAPVMGMLLIITIFLSAFSYFFEESNIIQPIAVAYGIILGQAHKERKRYEN